MPRKGESDVLWNDLRIRWTGYKSRPDSIELVGQWAAESEEGIFYGCTNGMAGLYVNTTFQFPAVGDLDPITIFTSASKKEQRKQEALNRLVLFADGWRKTHSKSTIRR